MKNRILFFLTFTVFITSCSNFISGKQATPLPYEEREFIKLSTMMSDIPNITIQDERKNIKFYVVAFDGTGNNKYDIDEGSERKTIVAYLYDLLSDRNIPGQYYEGPGYNNLIDSALCITCIEKAETAVSDLKHMMSNDWDSIENLEVRVIVLGFSRGAAIGRHFMNLLDDNFQTSLSASYKNKEPLVRSTGIMFDTVPTSVDKKLQLPISPSTDYFIHVIAKNEHRDLFYGVKDFDPNYVAMPIHLNDIKFLTCPKGQVKSSHRHLQIELPGSHSDIGSSYSNGIGTIYRYYGLYILVKLGLIHDNQFKIEEPFYSQGYHDSRGYIDVIKEVFFGENQEREFLEVTAELLSDEDFELLDKRLNTMYRSSNTSFYTENTELIPLVFDVIKRDNKLIIIDNHSGIEANNIGYFYFNGTHTIKYHFAQSEIDSLLPLPQKVWDNIPSNKKTRIEFLLLENDDIKKAYLYVNCQKVFEY